MVLLQECRGTNCLKSNLKLDMNLQNKTCEHPWYVDYFITALKKTLIIPLIERLKDR